MDMVLTPSTTRGSIMAKKPLGTPLAPAGPQYAFFAKMQSLVLEYGDPSLAEIARNVHVSRQVLHRALRGPNLPSRALVVRVVDLLTSQDEGRQQQVRQDVLRHWTDAVRNHRLKLQTSAQFGLDHEAAAPEGSSADVAEDSRQAFAESLRHLRTQAGSPTLAEISGAMDGYGRVATPSSLSDWLNGKSVPRDRAIVQTLVKTLLRLPYGRSHEAEPQLLEATLTAWDKSHAVSSRRGNAKPK